jgi:hypothetical protein
MKKKLNKITSQTEFWITDSVENGTLENLYIDGLKEGNFNKVQTGH